ncbi:MAG: guanylate cyclase, partial [Deltaproteobacteria bacterium]|nr:guanylate cyclase [Deltaproteobacteria bacterium]
MTRVCPVCQETDLPERSRFCLSCGADVEHSGSVPYTPRHLARDVLTTRTARDGERKEVTILFADVAGSLAMAESLDPEDIHRTMDGFFGLALDAVHAHRGTINQFRGDGLMALFGAPQTWGEDAARGLRAALAIREATQDYSRRLEEELGLPFVLRLGLHTGSVWVGSVGNDLRSDYTAEGPTVGTAARLEQAARPGQILVSGETARRARRFFEFRREGPRHFRGLSKPVEVYELIGAGPYRDRFEAERAHGLTPFVGRERELAWLRDAAARHALVQIRGEAGIGKSRLALEFVS